MSKLFNYSNIALICVSFGVFTIGYLVGSFNVILIGVLCMFASNMIYSFLKWKEHIVFLVLHFTLFTFLLSRPTISMFRGNKWWYFNESAVCFALNALMLTLVFMRVGAIIANKFINRNESIRLTTLVIDDNREGFNYTLRIISLIFFFITMGVFLLVEFEKLNYMQGRHYEEYYISFVSQLPSYIHTLAAMMKYALCVFLATMPSKRVAFIPLALYLFSAIPSLVIGVRNGIVLNAVFILLYYLIRDIIGDREKWLGKIELGGIVLVVPVAVLFLAAYNYLRKGETVNMGIWESIVDLFYKQGVSFDVLCMGYEAIPNLPDTIPKNYTFGGIIDYLTHGNIAQSLFGTIDLGTQNSEIKAVYGSSFAHSMSYVAHPNYLNGEGWGSSYLLETFADWGYIGIIIFSVILGAIMLCMVSAMKKGIFTRIVIMVGLTGFFFVPRAEATGWISFIITMQFWLAIGFCYFCATVLSNKNTYIKNYKY